MSAQLPLTERAARPRQPQLIAEKRILLLTPHALPCGAVARTHALSILYVAARWHILSREITNHVECLCGVLDAIRELLDETPKLPAPLGILVIGGAKKVFARNAAAPVARTAMLEKSKAYVSRGGAFRFRRRELRYQRGVAFQRRWAQHRASSACQRSTLPDVAQQFPSSWCSQPGDISFSEGEEM